MNNHLNFMQQAVELSSTGMHNHEGGPFGCVIVKDGSVVGKGNNKVFLNNDPTAHAEIVAIRDACTHLQTNTLDGCELYTSCEPCPMCLSAIYWARIKKIYYANTCADAAHIGFDDEAIYREMSKSISERALPMENIGREIAIKVFNEWEEKEDKELY